MTNTIQPENTIEVMAYKQLGLSIIYRAVTDYIETTNASKVRSKNRHWEAERFLFPQSKKQEKYTLSILELAGLTLGSFKKLTKKTSQNAGIEMPKGVRFKWK